MRLAASYSAPAIVIGRHRLGGRTCVRGKRRPPTVAVPPRCPCFDRERAAELVAALSRRRLLAAHTPDSSASTTGGLELRATTRRMRSLPRAALPSCARGVTVVARLRLRAAARRFHRRPTGLPTMWSSCMKATSRSPTGPRCTGHDCSRQFTDRQHRASAARCTAQTSSGAMLAVLKLRAGAADGPVRCPTPTAGLSHRMSHADASFAGAWPSRSVASASTATDRRRGLRR